MLFDIFRKNMVWKLEDNAGEDDLDWEMLTKEENELPPRSIESGK